MKETKRYMCEICNTEYNDKNRAVECEKNHKKIKKIDSCKYTSYKGDNTGLPASVVIEFDNGEKIRYSRF